MPKYNFCITPWEIVCSSTFWSPITIMSLMCRISHLEETIAMFKLVVDDLEIELQSVKRINTTTLHNNGLLRATIRDLEKALRCSPTPRNSVVTARHTRRRTISQIDQTIIHLSKYSIAISEWNGALEDTPRHKNNKHSMYTFQLTMLCEICIFCNI